MADFRQMVAHLQLHLLHEYPADQWLMTDPATYAFFKDRAAKKKAPTEPSVQVQAVQPATLAAKPATVSAPKTEPASTAKAPQVPAPPPSKFFQLTPPPPPPATNDPNALRSLLAQVAPALNLRDMPATKEELAIPPQILIFCPAAAPAPHRTVLNNLAKAITRSWAPCEVIDPAAPSTQTMLRSSLKLVIAEGTHEISAPFLSIPSIEALVVDPQSKIALWKEITARLGSCLQPAIK